VEYSAPPALRKSEALHQRLVAYARSFEEKASRSKESFETLALEIARFQMEHCPGFARLCPMQPGQLNSISQIPVVPSDVFRLTRVALHPAELDEARFRTSGTTTELTGTHPVRRLNTKEQLALVQAQHTLFRDYGRGIVVALAPFPDGTSSLGHMMQLFMHHFDGRALLADPAGAAFSLHEPGRFLIQSHGVDVEGLRRAARLAKHRVEPLYILATSFAMVAALDALDGETIPAPQRTKVMLTGGFKGRTRAIDEGDLRSAIAHSFGISTSSIVGEYGMTELSSQLFEHPFSEAEHGSQGVLAGALSRPKAAWWELRAPSGLYIPPPWLKVRALCPQTYEEVAPTESGLAHFIDLANIDSCISVLTQDMIRLVDGGVQLLGRAPHAQARGCSLPFEALAFAPPMSRA
jgi:hypothetical protein